ncbi:MAG: DUF3626 domain-containing protein [Deltaproteobacteria bacterium]|nr:DUF3626 domain-containing protein [Deltaproteobacteria bacterium]
MPNPPPGRRQSLDDYIEAQVHGRISIAEDAEALVADPSFRGTATGEALEMLGRRYDLRTSALRRTRTPSSGKDSAGLGSAVRRVMRIRAILVACGVLLFAACSDDEVPADSSVGDSGIADTGGDDTGPVDSGATDSGTMMDAEVDSGADDSAVPDDSGMMSTDGALLACTLDELSPILECASSACVMLPDASLSDASLDASLPDPGELATCILTNCGLLVFGVSTSCRGCLLAGVGMDLGEIGAACAPGLPLP